MTYRLIIAVDAERCHLEVEEPHIEGVLAFWEEMGGTREGLTSAIRGSVARTVHGEATGTVVRMLGGTVVETTEAAPEPAPPAPPAEDTGPADPWTSDRDYPGEATVARSALTTDSGPAADDPWGEDQAGSKEPQPASQSRTGPAVRMVRDSFDREWTLNLPGAPPCDCGEPAAKVKAKSKAGRWFTTYKCAKGAGEDWRDKCEFSVFPD